VIPPTLSGTGVPRSPRRRAARKGTRVARPAEGLAERPFGWLRCAALHWRDAVIPPTLSGTGVPRSLRRCAARKGTRVARPAEGLAERPFGLLRCVALHCIGGMR